MIAVVDYKAGNVASLTAALERLGQKYVVTNNPNIVQQADHVIFPGQGRAAPAMQELQRTGLAKIIPTFTQPFLGICLGMQLLCDWSAEDDVACLGIIPGNVIRFQTDLPVPQVGWNTMHPLVELPILAGIPKAPYMYFVHSYYVAAPPQYILATTNYDNQFASIIAKDNFIGMQFHPEKSAEAGQQLLANFCRL